MLGLRPVGVVIPRYVSGNHDAVSPPTTEEVDQALRVAQAAGGRKCEITATKRDTLVKVGRFEPSSPCAQVKAEAIAYAHLD